MTDSAQFVPTRGVSKADLRARPPTTVYAAVVITMTLAIGTVLVTVPFAVVGLWIAGPLAENFGSSSADARWAVAVIELGLVTLSGAFFVLALYVLRGLTWASRVLMALATAAALVGGILAYYILPLVMTIAGVVVIVLLLMPSTRSWFHGQERGPMVTRPPA